MKAVGESMAIGRTFKESFQKALRSLENDRLGFGSDGNLKELIELHKVPSSEKEHLSQKQLKFLPINESSI